MDITALLTTVKKAKPYGVCHLAIYDKPRGVHPDSILASHFSAYTASTKELTVLSDLQAYAILTRLLIMDMAYDVEMMPLEEAQKLASAFLALFSNQSVFLSNSSWNTDEATASASGFEPKLCSWLALTDATFDSGIIVCDSDKIGIAWFEDED